MKKVTNVNALQAMSNTEINNLIKIKSTSYNRNRRYGDLTRSIWKKLYDAGHTVSEIANAYGAHFNTVKVVVDQAYRNNLNIRRSTMYNPKYRESTPSKHESGYEANLAKHKLNPSVAHLKTI